MDHLQLGDVNGDGHWDIFAAEMAKWHEQQPQPDNPTATAWVFYGDGQGGFTPTELVKGQGWHEARLRRLAERQLSPTWFMVSPSGSQ